MDEQEFTVTFWGVRGSYPAPGPETTRIGGNTTSVEIRASGRTLILDAGTGIIGLGRQLNQRAAASGHAPQATLLFTHMHHDHTQGFPFFSTAYHPAAQLHIFGPAAFDRSLAEVLGQTMVPPNFPLTLKDMNASMDIHELGQTDVLRLEPGESAPRALHFSEALQPASPESVQVRLMRSYAHPGTVLLYRVEHLGKAFVFASDTEGYVHTDRRLATFALNADLLVHDAQYSEAHYLGLVRGLPATQGYGHSTPRMAAEVALAAEVKLLALTHYDPTYTDTQVDELVVCAQRDFPNSIAAREGLTLDLLQPEADAALLRLPATVAAE